MATVSATGMQENLEHLLSKTIMLQPSAHIDRVYGQNLDDSMIAKHDAKFLSDSRQFVRSLGSHVHEGLDLVHHVQDHDFEELPQRTQKLINEWAEQGRILATRYENTIKDKQLVVTEAQDMQELCSEAVSSLYDLEKDIQHFSGRPELEVDNTSDFDQPLDLSGDEALSVSDLDQDGLR